MPRLAPVTRATGLFCCGKFGFYGLGHIFECESLDERPSVDQDSWSLGDPARHTLLIILFHQAGEASIAESIYGLRGIDAVIFRELGEPLVKIPACDFAQVGHGVLAVSKAGTGANPFKITPCNRGPPSPGVF